jgi:hypothetical protein
MKNFKINIYFIDMLRVFDRCSKKLCRLTPRLEKNKECDKIVNNLQGVSMGKMLWIIIYTCSYIVFAIKKFY